MVHNRSPSNGRIDWIDYAKSICIIAVVTMYATNEVQGLRQATGWMQHVVDFAQPFRMPDFFLLAGLLVPRVIDKPLRAYLDTKVFYFVYFYTLWITITFVVRDLHGILGPEPFALLPEYAELFYIGPPWGPLWFIYILALFFLAVRFLRSWPVPLVLAVAAALQMADLKTHVILVDRFAHYFVFFYSGYVFAQYLFRTADWAKAHMRLTVAIIALWFAANTMLVQLGWASLPGMSLLMGYAGAIAVMFLATLLARIPRMQWLCYLGQHSIVIYLGFVIPLKMMRVLIVDPALITDVGHLALAATVISIIGALILYWGVRNTPLSFLFSRPAWISIGRAPQARPYNRRLPD